MEVLRLTGEEVSRLSVTQLAIVAGGGMLVCAIVLLWRVVAPDFGKRLGWPPNAIACASDEDVDIEAIIKEKNHSTKGQVMQRQAEDLLNEEIRRRMLLRRIEQEINGAILETNARNHDSLGDNHAVTFSKDQMAQLRVHPVECTTEFAVLMKNPRDGPQDQLLLKRTLHMLHDVLTFHLSSEFRDVNKVSVFCNALLRHDALDRLRLLQSSKDPEIARLATLIIEKAVPFIWQY